MNQVNIIGRLVSAPELRFTASGKSVCHFRLARNERYGAAEKTLFIDISVWGTQAEAVAQHKKKGDQVAVSGRLEFEEFTNAEGLKRSKISITANEVLFLARKKENGSSDPHQDATGQTVSAQEENDEESIPF